MVTPRFHVSKKLLQSNCVFFIRFNNLSFVVQISCVFFLNYSENESYKHNIYT